MKRRPDEPWPRGQGHVLLAVPGSDEDAKAYQEPGAGFSPAFGSFGVSIQVEDKNGRRIAAGDTVSMGDVRQRLVWKSPKEVPGILTRTKQFAGDLESFGKIGMESGSEGDSRKSGARDSECRSGWGSGDQSSLEWKIAIGQRSLALNAESDAGGDYIK